MKISKLIKELEKCRREKGNIEVQIWIDAIETPVKVRGIAIPEDDNDPVLICDDTTMSALG